MGNWWPSVGNTRGITDSEIASLANKSLQEISLFDLAKHGRPPLSRDNLISSANFTLSLIPNRLAYIIKALWHLPYMVVANPNISKVFNDHIRSLSTLLSHNSQHIAGLEDEDRLTCTLVNLINIHSRSIPYLARGFLECQKYMNWDEVDNFLNDHLHARIGTRLIAEQHIALHHSSQPHQSSPQGDQHRGVPSSYMGVLDTALKPLSVIQSCAKFVTEICEAKYGLRPSYVISGDASSTIAYVPVYLEYIITELLKNAFRATIENAKYQEPVVITIAALPCPFYERNTISDYVSTNPVAQDMDPRTDLLDNFASEVTIRIQDRGGGISPEIFPCIWSYSFTKFSDDISRSRCIAAVNSSQSNFDLGNGSSSVAGLGYGLPFARVYAEYFGGGIAIQNLHGWGCDVYLRIRGLR